MPKLSILVALLRLATFNCENLFARFKFNRNIDPKKALENGWVANETHFDILKEEEKKFTAAAIKATDADVVALQEVENLPALREFRNRFLKKQGYDHMIVIDGNDPRFIDVGVLSRYAIENIDTHIHEKDGQSRYPLFSRDCLECDIVLPEEKRLRLFVNHFKSMYNPKNPCNGRKDTRNRRLPQAVRVKQIVAEEFPDSSLDSDQPFAILGDFNDYLETDSQGETSVGDLVNWERVENIVTRLPEQEQWTHYYEGNRKCGFGKTYKQLDYILLSKSLADRNASAKVDIVRKGLPLEADRYKGSRFPGIGRKSGASDHCPVVVEIDV